MKMPSKVLAGLLIFLLAACKETPKNESPEQAKVTELMEAPVAQARFTDLKGNPVELADYKGKRILLNYWATWCKPCIEEMPVLARLEEQLSEDNYVFLFASDQALKVIQKFKDTKKFDLYYLKYNGSWADENINALPVTLIYNAVGEQVERFDGFIDWETPEIMEKLKAL